MAKILIIDDHPVVVEGILKLIKDNRVEDECIVAYSANESIRILKFFNPDLIMLDYSLPDGNGIDLCKEILKKNKNFKILGISSFKEQSIMKEMLKCGAMGFVLKNASNEEILEAIDDVLKGKKYLCDLTSEITNSENINYTVTRREIEVLKLIAEGFTNNEIAQKLFISPLTIDSHRKNLLLKFNARNTAVLIKMAAKKGYI
jgi:DNA-binding NarL/FixJ family response regulator